MPSKRSARPVASGEFPINPDGGFVYSAFDQDGDLLYVGYTDDLARRLAGHRRERSAWLNFATRITWRLFATQDDALAEERATIKSQRPRFNVIHNEDRTVADSMGHTRRYDDDAWAGLGRRVKAERTGAYRSVVRFCRDAGIDRVTLASIEAGTTTIYPRDVLASVEEALSWRPGSLEAVLSGGDPEPLSRDERVVRAVAHARSLSLADRL